MAYTLTRANDAVAQQNASYPLGERQRVEDPMK